MPEIAKRVGLSERSVRRSYRRYLEYREPEASEWRQVEEALDLLNEIVREAADNAAHAPPGSSARTGALRIMLEAVERQLAMRQALGKIPRYLGDFAQRGELETVLREFAEVLDRHEVGEALMDDFIELAERVAQRRGRPVIEGRAA